MHDLESKLFKLAEKLKSTDKKTSEKLFQLATMAHDYLPPKPKKKEPARQTSMEKTP
jgi:hypothetical protein